MPTSPSNSHDCKPLWITGSVRATCATHYWQPVPGTAVNPKPATR